MTYFDRKLEVPPQGSSKGPVRAKLINSRLGLQDIIIDNASSSELGAVAIGASPFVGERIKILLPTGREIAGIVSWTRQKAFWISLDEAEGPADHLEP